MVRVRKIFAGVGLLMVIASVLLSLNPELIPTSVIPVSQDFFLIGALLFLIMVFGLYGLQSFRLSSVDRSDMTLEVEENPESVKDKGERHSVQFQWDDEEHARREIRDTLGDVLMDQYDCSAEEATKIVETGEWTDNGVAAAFVYKGIKYPLIERLREWLEEEGTFDRRLKNTVEAMEKLHEAEN